MADERPRLTASEIEAQLSPSCRSCLVCVTLNP